MISEGDFLSHYGMPKTELDRVNGKFEYEKSPLERFRMQKGNAHQRGIEWEMNFAEWWGVWEQSGEYENRGREIGQFVMSRFGDVGSYSADNVKIVTCSENCSDGSILSWELTQR